MSLYCFERLIDLSKRLCSHTALGSGLFGPESAALFPFSSIAHLRANTGTNLEGTS